LPHSIAKLQLHEILQLVTGFGHYGVKSPTVLNYLEKAAVQFRKNFSKLDLSNYQALLRSFLSLEFTTNGAKDLVAMMAKSVRNKLKSYNGKELSDLVVSMSAFSQKVKDKNAAQNLSTPKHQSTDANDACLSEVSSLIESVVKQAKRNPHQFKLSHKIGLVSASLRLGLEGEEVKELFQAIIPAVKQNVEKLHPQQILTICSAFVKFKFELNDQVRDMFAVMKPKLQNLLAKYSLPELGEVADVFYYFGCFDKPFYKAWSAVVNEKNNASLPIGRKGSNSSSFSNSFDNEQSFKEWLVNAAPRKDDALLPRELAARKGLFEFCEKQGYSDPNTLKLYEISKRRCNQAPITERELSTSPRAFKK